MEETPKRERIIVYRSMFVHLKGGQDREKNLCKKSVKIDVFSVTGSF